MKNKKTTVFGYITVVGAAIYVLGTALTGGDFGAALQQVLLPALAGAGLVAAADGGH